MPDLSGLGEGALLNYLAGSADSSPTAALRGVVSASSRLEIPVGSYWQNAHSSSATSGIISTPNRGHYSMFVVPFPMTVNEVRVNLAAGGGTGDIRFGIYDMDSTGTKPGALLSDVGGTSLPANGILAYTGLNIRFPRGGIFWLATMANFGGLGISTTLWGPSIVTTSAKTSLTIAAGWRDSADITTGPTILTDPWPAVAGSLIVNSTNAAANQPIIEFRRSA